MTTSLSDRIWRALACPSCGGSLARQDGRVRCRHCAEAYGYTAAGQLDLRLAKRKRYELTFELGAPALAQNDVEFTRLPRHPAPEVDFTGVTIPKHVDAELLSHFPRARTRESLVLDLGCGDGLHREVCERAGFGYVGVDYQSPAAMLLGDAHALPFRDESFEFILSVSVLEHIQYPFVMAKEMHRVLQPRGRVVGTVAFLEPYHGASLYHHSHLGVYNSLAFAGFRVERIAPSRSWSILSATATMALFPRLPKPVCKALVLPLTLLHRGWWRLQHRAGRGAWWSEQDRLLGTTGTFAFIARKA